MRVMSVSYQLPTTLAKNHRASLHSVFVIHCRAFLRNAIFPGV